MPSKAEEDPESVGKALIAEDLKTERKKSPLENSDSEEKKSPPKKKSTIPQTQEWSERLEIADETDIPSEPVKDAFSVAGGTTSVNTPAKSTSTCMSNHAGHCEHWFEPLLHKLSQRTFDFKSKDFVPVIIPALEQNGAFLTLLISLALMHQTLNLGWGPYAVHLHI